MMKRARLLDPDWLTVAFSEQTKLHVQENLLPDSVSNKLLFVHI